MQMGKNTLASQLGLFLSVYKKEERKEEKKMEQPPPSPRVAIYTRVSTNMQAADGCSLDVQERELRGYAEYVLNAKPEDITVYCEAGVSAKDTTHRPVYQQMIEAVKAGRHTHILVYKLDRLSRSVIDTLSIFEQMDKLGIKIVSKSEQIDTGTPAGKLMLTVLSALAAMEREQTAERVRDTMISRATAGTWNGGRVPYGYRYVSETKLDMLKNAGEDIGEIEPGFYINTNEADIVTRIYDQYMRERSVTAIVQTLNQEAITTRSGKQWSAHTVWTILRSPWYMGTYRYNRYRGTVGRKENPADKWVMIPAHHPAIITKSMWDQVQSLIIERRTYESNKEHHHRPWSSHVLRSLVYCDICNTRMIGTASRTYAGEDNIRAVTYTCPEAKTGKCSNTTAQQRIICDIVFSLLRNIIRAKESMSKVKNPDQLSDILCTGIVLRDIERIDPADAAGLYDELRRYRSDASYTTAGGFPGRRQRTIAPEEEKLKREQHRLHTALVRLDDSYFSGKRPLPEETYRRRRNETQTALQDVEAKLGRLRAESMPSMSTADTIKAIAAFAKQDVIWKPKALEYKDYMPQLDQTQTRETLEHIIDSIRVKNGKIRCITLTDGTSLHLMYYKDNRKEEEAC